MVCYSFKNAIQFLSLDVPGVFRVREKFLKLVIAHVSPQKCESLRDRAPLIFFFSCAYIYHYMDVCGLRTLESRRELIGNLGTQESTRARESCQTIECGDFNTRSEYPQIF